MSLPIRSLRLPHSPLTQTSRLIQPSWQQVRSKITTPAALKLKRDRERLKKKKTQQTNFYRGRNLSKMEKFSLCDAMRYLRAFEVGRNPDSPKYEIHLRLKSSKDSPAIGNRILLPHAVRSTARVCVICPPDSEIAQQAIAAGATTVGTETVFEDIRNGRIEFDRLVAHEDYLASLMNSGIARILGPLHLMPSARTQTVTKDVASAVERMKASTKYAENKGVVRMAIGKVAFTPEQLSENIKVLMETIKKDLEKFGKEILEVVLSSTNGPGFSLTGRFMSERGCDPSLLKTIN